MEIVTLIIAIVSLLCSVIALVFTYLQTKRAKEEAETALLETLQSGYESIRGRMDPRYRDDTWRPDPMKPQEWGPLEEY